MKIILMQDLKHVGKQNDIVTVTDGYARNYLFPQKLAVEAAGGALKNLQTKHALEGRRDEKVRRQADNIKEKLTDKVVTVHAKSGAGKLYGRVTTQDIADEIERQFHVKVDKRKVNLIQPIKAAGEYEVPLKLHKDVIIGVKVAVVAA